MREPLLALRPDEPPGLARSISGRLLAPHVNGTRPAGDRLAILLACLRARGCTRCAAPLVEHAAYQAGQVLCPACAIVAAGGRPHRWCRWDADEAWALKRSLGRGIPDDDDDDEDDEED